MNSIRNQLPGAARFAAKCAAVFGGGLLAGAAIVKLHFLLWPESAQAFGVWLMSVPLHTLNSFAFAGLALVGGLLHWLECRLWPRQAVE